MPKRHAGSTPDKKASKFFDAAHEACRTNHHKSLARHLPRFETTQRGFGILLSECVHAGHSACTEVLLQHWKSVCSKVAFVPYEHQVDSQAPLPCPAMWADPAVCQVLIDAGTDIETRDKGSCTPLLYACSYGKLTIMKMLVEAGAAVCATNDKGATCLILAAYHGHTETVRYLVDVNHRNIAKYWGHTALNLLHHKSDDHLSALHYAVDLNHADVVGVLIDAGADIEARDKDFRTPLMFSCCTGELTIVKMLVEAGARVRAADKKGHTSLIYATAYGHTETVRYLVGLPAVDMSHMAHTDFGYTAVFVAAEKHADVLEVLIDAGADIEATNNIGMSPLLVASEHGNLRSVELLLKAGAGVCVADNKGDTCFTIAALGGHTETVRTLLCMPEVDVNQSNHQGFTPLHCTAFTNHSDVAQVLIDAGADIEARTRRGSTPLHCACQGGALENSQMLVEAGANVRDVDDQGRTCLSIAAYYGHTETVRYLVGLREVDVRHRNLRGRTALHYARQEQHAGVVRVLLKHGAGGKKQVTAKGKKNRTQR